MSETLDRSLCLSAREMALSGRKPPSSLVHHTNRGSQYKSSADQAALLIFGMVGSMTRKGNFWDNGVAESFFGTLKAELCHRLHFATRSQARQAILEYIEVFCNRERLHSTLDFRSPSTYEALYAQSQQAV